MFCFFFVSKWYPRKRQWTFLGKVLPQNNSSFNEQLPATADSSHPSRRSWGRDRTREGPKAGAALYDQHHLGESIPKPWSPSSKTSPMRAVRWPGHGDLHWLLHQPSHGALWCEPLPLAAINFEQIFGFGRPVTQVERDPLTRFWERLMAEFLSAATPLSLINF